MVVTILNGLVWSALLFTIASGLSLVFGVMDLINFAHGALYMFGGYFLATLAPHIGFWASVPLAVLGIALLGALLEIPFFKPLYDRAVEYQLLLTFGLVFILEDSAKMIWGAIPKSASKPLGFRGSLMIGEGQISTYYILLLVIGVLLAIGVWLLMERTTFGKLIRAASTDTEMADALGVNTNVLYTGVFAFGAGLAGLGGVLGAPIFPVNPSLGASVIITVFLIVVVGSLGSLGGAMAGSLIIGTLQTLITSIFPRFGVVAVFAIAVVIFISFPEGLGELAQGWRS